MNFYLSEKKMCGFAFLSDSDHHQSLTNESRQSFTFKSINLSIAACQTTIFRANIGSFTPFLYLNITYRLRGRP